MLDFLKFEVRRLKDETITRRKRRKRRSSSFRSIRRMFKSPKERLVEKTSAVSESLNFRRRCSMNSIEFWEV